MMRKINVDGAEGQFRAACTNSVGFDWGTPRATRSEALQDTEPMKGLAPKVWVEQFSEGQWKKVEEVQDRKESELSIEKVIAKMSRAPVPESGRWRPDAPDEQASRMRRFPTLEAWWNAALEQNEAWFSGAGIVPAKGDPVMVGDFWSVAEAARIVERGNWRGVDRRTHGWDKMEPLIRKWLA